MGIAKARKGVDADCVAVTVRRVFGSSQDFYTLGEAAVLLGWSRSQMTRAIERGRVTVTQDALGVQIGWREVALALTTRYPQAGIEEALGPALASVIPESVRLADIRLRIPRYQIVMLEGLAGRQRISVDEFMTRHLLDLASAEGDWLRRRVPGFESAMRWPEE